MARKPATFSVSKTIDAKRARVAELHSEIKQIKEHKGMLDLAAKLCEYVARVARTHSEVQWPTSNIHTGYGLQYDASFEMPVTSLKDGPLVAVLEAAMEAGFTPEETYDSANAYEGTRVYPMKIVIADLRVTLRIRAVVQEAEGATCKRVAVGTKYEEVVQYALQCE